MELIRVNTLVHVDKWATWLNKLLKTKLVRYVDGERQTYTEPLYTRPEGDLGGYFVAGFLDDVIRMARSKGIEPRYCDLRVIPEHAYDTDLNALNVQLRYKQDAIIEAIMTNDKGIVKCPTGMGKCLGKGTPVMRYDGSIVPVESIQVGDLLMGPDSKPRKVLELSRGYGKLYKFIPTKGDTYIFNENHVLTLCPGAKAGCKYEGHQYAQGEMFDVPLTSYLKQHNKFKHLAKAVRASVDFEPREAPELDPYFVGVWLGDGGCGTNVLSNPDPEVYEYCRAYGESRGWEVSSRLEAGSDCCIRMYFSSRVDGHYIAEGAKTTIRRNTMSGAEKRILPSYKFGSREVRQKVLAGLLDTDGYYNAGCYEITTKFEGLAQDIIFVARSLGLAAYCKPSRKQCTNTGAWGDYYRIGISGDATELPIRIPRKKQPCRKMNKNPLLTGFEIVPAGEGEYYGFSVDGDHRYLLGDFTVTHNSFILKCLTVIYPNAKFVICTEAASVVQSLYESLVEVHGKAQVGMIKGGTSDEETTKRIQVSTTKSILRSQIRQCDFLLFDEVHNVGKNQITDVLLNNVEHARMFGFTASLWRGDHAEDLIKGLFGEVIAEATYQEAVDHSLVVPIKALMIPCKTKEKQVTDSMMLDRKFNYICNYGRNKLIAEVAGDIPEDEQVLIMVDTFEHAVRLHQFPQLSGYTVCHGGNGTKVKRNRPWEEDTAPESVLVIHKAKGSVHLLVRVQTAMETVAFREAEITGPTVTPESIGITSPEVGQVINNEYVIRPSADDDSLRAVPIKLMENLLSLPKVFADYIQSDGSSCGAAQSVDRNIAGADMSQYKMTGKKIAQIRRDFESGKLKKLIATNIFSEGVNFVHLKYLIRADGEISKISNTQIPGRLSRLFPGKECAYLIDFVDHFSPWAYQRSCIRFEDYKSAGWVTGPIGPRDNGKEA